MKKSALYIFLLVFIFLYSCNRNPPGSSGKGALSGSNDSTSQCYESSSGLDSASLVLKHQYGRIEGSLSLYFAEKDDMTGKITGNFVGDTLFVDYTFRSGSNQEYFQNPLAFLKKDGKLYQGYGEIVPSYGRNQFKKGVPIDFNKGFVFNLVDCK